MTNRIGEEDLLPNPHPGEILLEDFLKPMELSQSALARAVGVPPRRINEVVLGKRAVTAETDLLLARYFGISEGIFLGLVALKLRHDEIARPWRDHGVDYDPVAIMKLRLHTRSADLQGKRGAADGRIRCQVLIAPIILYYF